MQPRWKFLLLGLALIFSLGCSVLSANPGEDGPAATELVQATAPPLEILPPLASPTAAAQPTAAQPTAAPATAAPVEPTAAPAPTQAAAGPVNSLPEPQPGPDTLDLSDPAIYQNPLTDFQANFRDQVDSTGQDGQPMSMATDYLTRFQTQPAAAWSSSSSFLDETTRETRTALDGTLYLVSADGQCSTGTAGDPPSSPVAGLQGALQGQAQRVEAGVEVNGLLADRYEIKADNLAPDAKIEIKESTTTSDGSSNSTLTIKVHGTGSLYLAQQGGFILRVELSDNGTATQDEFFFKPGSEMKSQTLLELVPAAPGDAPLAVPEACGGTAAGGEGGGEAGGLVFPRPEGVSILTDDEDTLIYQTTLSQAELEAFYRAEMEALGFSLESNMKVGPILELSFSLGEQTVSVTIMPMGDQMSVTVTGY